MLRLLPQNTRHAWEFAETLQVFPYPVPQLWIFIPVFSRMV